MNVWAKWNRIRFSMLNLARNAVALKGGGGREYKFNVDVEM